MEENFQIEDRSAWMRNISFLNTPFSEVVLNGRKFQSPIILGTMQYNVPPVILPDNYEHKLSAFRTFSLECDPKMWHKKYLPYKM